MKLSAPLFRLKREARQLSRREALPLHQALDRIARREGFKSWSHLSAKASAASPAESLLTEIEAGDLVLLGARPGQGKTLLGLELAARAAHAGRPAFFFTLEYGEAQLGDLLPQPTPRGLTLDTSDEISADYIAKRLEAAAPGALAVIDYLQILDQKRSNPPLAEQLRRLKALAAAGDHSLILISQIDRRFDARQKRLPDLSDVRLPNPVDLTLFSKTCFLHGGEILLAAPA
ncbi:DNA helicase [Limibacillus halophilus]